MEKKKLFYRKILFLIFAAAQLCVSARQSADSTSAENYYRDLYSDTWVASDALGRKMPAFNEVGPVKKDQRRIVSIFYITWHTMDHYKNFKSPYSADVTKILKSDPSARLDAKHPLWKEGSYHWGEPEMGYFLSQDEYVIRKDMSMLTDAGVDVLVMDVNHPHYGDQDYTEEFYKDYTKEVKNFFTKRTMWWGYNEWAGNRFVASGNR
jgi:hypothetical protein